MGLENNMRRSRREGRVPSFVYSTLGALVLGLGAYGIHEASALPDRPVYAAPGNQLMTYYGERPLLVATNSGNQLLMRGARYKIIGREDNRYIIEVVGFSGSYRGNISVNAFSEKVETPQIQQREAAPRKVLSPETQFIREVAARGATYGRNLGVITVIGDSLSNRSILLNGHTLAGRLTVDGVSSYYPLQIAGYQAGCPQGESRLECLLNTGAETAGLATVWLGTNNAQGMNQYNAADIAASYRQHMSTITGTLVRHGVFPVVLTSPPRYNDLNRDYYIQLLNAELNSLGVPVVDVYAAIENVDAATRRRLYARDGLHFSDDMYADVLNPLLEEEIDGIMSTVYDLR